MREQAWAREENKRGQLRCCGLSSATDHHNPSHHLIQLNSYVLCEVSAMRILAQTLCLRNSFEVRKERYQATEAREVGM